VRECEESFDWRDVLLVPRLLGQIYPSFIHGGDMAAMAESAYSCSINQVLSNDILLHVFAYLDPYELSQIMTVCT
jgi:acyl-coenzyme A thioesterase PaaI-like protein